jgi:hypothetical protein
MLRLGPSSNRVQSIQGPISFNAGTGGGNDTVTIYNSADTVGRTLHIESEFVGRMPGDNLFGPGGYLQYAGVSGTMTIKLGTGDDIIYGAPHPLTPLVIEGNQPAASDLLGRRLHLRQRGAGYLRRH